MSSVIYDGCTSEGIRFQVSHDPILTSETISEPFVKKGRMVYEDVPLSLNCEWEHCDAPIFNDMRRFMAHVDSHLEQVEVKQTACVDNPSIKETSFLCLWADCGYESAVSTDMMRHIHFHTFHTKIKSHGQATMLETNIECYMDSAERNIIPDVSEPFLCSWAECSSADDEFIEAQKYYWHVIEHAEDLRGTKHSAGYSCRWYECKSTTASITKMKEHLRSHVQERRVACPKCGALFSSRCKFFDHCKRQEQQQNEGAAPYECSYCNKKFAIERLLRDHMRIHVNHCKCPYCDMTCSNPSNLSKHILYKHSDSRPFACEVCKFSAKTLKDLNSHLKVHLERKQQKCQECDYKTAYEPGLRRHFRTKHLKEPSTYECHLCAKQFSRGNYLSKHFGTAHGLRPPKGHSRFQYILQADAIYRLQTVRFEATEEILEDEDLRHTEALLDNEQEDGHSPQFPSA